MIYLTKEDWNELILSKLLKKVSFNNQFFELFKINVAFHYFIKNIYKELITPAEQNYLLIASTVIFHKYRVCTNFSINNFSTEEIYIILGACLSVGQATTNILKNSINKISDFIYDKILEKEPNKKFEKQTILDNIKNRQFEILYNIGFNIEVDFPFSFINKVKNHLSKIPNLPQSTFPLLNSIIKESFIMPFCLYYTPNIITISSILMLKDKFKLNYINIKELISLSEYDLDEEDIQQCTVLLKVLDDAVVERNKKKIQNKGNENTKVINDINQVNSDTTSVTKIIPNIRMNID